MAAERKNAGGSRPREHLTLVALYELEERAEELLERLSALSIDTSDATIVRVELNEAQRAAKRTALPRPPSLSPAARSTVTGAILGAAIVLLIGLTAYETGLLSLPFLEGLFAHALTAAMLGGAAGAAVGGALASARKAVARPPAAPSSHSATGEGFLVVIKAPPHLAEQAEAIARRLGAKEIIL
jgi:hypothetical protein